MQLVLHSMVLVEEASQIRRMDRQQSSSRPDQRHLQIGMPPSDQLQRYLPFVMKAEGWRWIRQLQKRRRLQVVGCQSASECLCPERTLADRPCSLEASL